MVWVFLRTLRGALVVAVVIPLALLCAFSGLHALGMPANLISMGAIDFGILVDAAVVLVENVFHALGKERPTTRPKLLEVLQAFETSLAARTRRIDAASTAASAWIDWLETIRALRAARPAP